MTTLRIRNTTTAGRIRAAAQPARIAANDSSSRLTPILPFSVVSGGAGGGQVNAQPALIPAGGISLIGTPFVEDDFVLTAQHIAEKGVTLTRTPADPTKIEFVPYGGPEQRANVDFVVSGRFLSWASLALELLLAEGSAITVRYVTT